MLTEEASCTEENHSDPGINRLKCEFISKGMSEEWGSWNDYWKKMADDFPNYYNPNYWQIQATALFLKKDIQVLHLQSTGRVSFNKYFHNNVNMKIGDSTTLFIGNKTDLHFQSLLEVTKTKKKKPDNEEQEDTKCPNCQQPFEHILKHISKSKCKDKVNDEFIQELRRNAEAKHRFENKVRKANSRRKIQMHENYDQREERLKRKKTEVKEERRRKLKENPDELRKKEKMIKRSRRFKQKAENPNYENPKFKENIRMVYSDSGSETRWKAKKFDELEIELFGEETLEQVEKRYEKEREVHGKETWEERFERYKNLKKEMLWKEQKSKEKCFLEKNKDLL